MTAAKLRNENQKTVIKTDDLNVDQPKETNREYAVPGQIKRDTAAVAGGKQVESKLSKKMLPIWERSHFCCTYCGHSMEFSR